MSVWSKNFNEYDLFSLLLLNRLAIRFIQLGKPLQVGVEVSLTSVRTTTYVIFSAFSRDEKDNRWRFSLYFCGLNTQIVMEERIIGILMKRRSCLEFAPSIFAASIRS